jgi:PBP1b-binding outer membrane lipoprotein LpoB
MRATQAGLRHHHRSVTMKKTLFASLALAILLAGCSGPKDTKLSEMNEPAQAVKLRETLTNEEVELLRKFVIRETLDRTIDYKMTVQQAIDAQRKLDEGVKNALGSIK